MAIKLGEQYLIESDKYNWILKERRVTDPNHPLSKTAEAKEYFVDIGYYGKFEHLVNSLLNKELRRVDIDTLQDLKELLLQVENKLKIEVVKAVKEDASN